MSMTGTTTPRFGGSPGTPSGNPDPSVALQTGSGSAGGGTTLLGTGAGYHISRGDEKKNWQAVIAEVNARGDVAG